MAQETVQPNTCRLAQSLVCLYESEHLGVLLANVDGITDANDALLRMIGYSREEMETGAIDRREITPQQWHRSDDLALEQLIEHGASVPYEKEYVLRDGSVLPILIGGIRLKPEPLEWMCYVVNLSDRKRADEADMEKRRLQAQSAVVNQIAHELNNPLAALTFVLEALRMKTSTADADVRELFVQGSEMIARMNALTRAVLAAASKTT